MSLRIKGAMKTRMSWNNFINDPKKNWSPKVLNKAGNVRALKKEEKKLKIGSQSEKDVAERDYDFILRTCWFRYVIVVQDKNYTITLGIVIIQSIWW